MDIALTASLVSPILAAEANGPHAVITDLARGLAERGHRTTVYAAAGSQLEGIDLVAMPVRHDAGAAQIRPGSRAEPIDLTEDFARLFAAVERGGHDVLSQHAFDAPALLLDPGLPVLHTLHLPPLVPGVVAAARETTAPLAAVSATSFAAWEAAGTRPDWLLWNGVPDHGFGLERPEAAALVAGRVSPEKGTDVAIRAALMAGLRPWVVGDPYDRDYFEAKVRPLFGDARYFGAVPRQELSELMGRASVLVMPIGWPEAFGLVAAEAQMAGCPVVAYRRGALIDVIEDGISGILVEPDAEAALPPAIKSALALDRRLVRGSAVRRLSVDHMISAYEQALGQVANGARLTTGADGPTRSLGVKRAQPALTVRCRSALRPGVSRCSTPKPCAIRASAMTQRHHSASDHTAVESNDGPKPHEMHPRRRRVAESDWCLWRCLLGQYRPSLHVQLGA